MQTLGNQVARKCFKKISSQLAIIWLKSWKSTFGKVKVGRMHWSWPTHPHLCPGFRVLLMGTAHWVIFSTTDSLFSFRNNQCLQNDHKLHENMTQFSWKVIVETPLERSTILLGVETACLSKNPLTYPSLRTLTNHFAIKRVYFKINAEVKTTAAWDLVQQVTLLLNLITMSSLQQLQKTWLEPAAFGAKIGQIIEEAGSFYFCSHVETTFIIVDCLVP